MQIRFPKYLTNKFLNLFAYCFFILLLSAEVQAQSRVNLGGSSRLMNSARAEMDKGDYEKANGYFRQIIENNLPIPAEMPYFFAETLFQLGQFDNSSSFLNKYLEINGFKGDNYESAKALEIKLQKPLKEILDCQICDRRGYRYQTCSTCEGQKTISQSCNYCKAKGTVGCTQCRGSGVITKRNVFNLVEYHECQKCSGDGRITCPKCDGTHVEHSDCRTCKGSGRLLTEEICDHDQEEKPRHLSMIFRNLQKEIH